MLDFGNSTMLSSTALMCWHSDEQLSKNAAQLEKYLGRSLRDLLRAFTLNPAACESVVNDSSLVELRSESASEIIRQLKVGFDPVISVCSQ